MSDLQERYGRRPPASEQQARTRRLGVVALILGTLTVVGFWAATSLGVFAPITAQTVRYAIAPDGQSAHIDGEISAPSDARLTCSLEAQDERNAIIGWDLVEVPPDGTGIRRISRDIRTVGVPSRAYVSGCWRAK